MPRAARTEASAAECFSACGWWEGPVFFNAVLVAGLIGESYRVSVRGRVGNVGLLLAASYCFFWFGRGYGETARDEWKTQADV